MKTKTFTQLLTLVLLMCSAAAWAQVEEPKFGNIEKAELELRTYAQDTSAAAVVLADFGYTRFNLVGGLTVVTERHLRIKILKKSGYDWANVSIPYYHDGSTKDRVTGIKGFTFNLEGGQVTKDKLETNTVFDEKRNEYWRLKKFTMPNVKEGSVIDVVYTLTSERVYSLDDWEFQKTIPTVWSEYRLRIPEYFDYKFLMEGYHSLAKNGKELTSGGANMVNNAYVWAMQDIPALKEERYISSLTDYQAKIAFELLQVNFPGEPTRIMTGTWDKVAEDLMGSAYFGAQLNRNNFFKEELAVIKAKHQQPKEQLFAIYDLVKTRMTWNGYNGLYTDNPIRKAFDLRQGNVAEINLLLTAMLMEAGLEANPVVLSTRSNGRIRTTMSPMKSKFNYVIAHVKVGEEEFLLDATEPLLPAGMLPFRCLNGEGRLISKESHRWVPLKTAYTDTKLFRANIAINSNGAMEGTGSESSLGNNALYLRKTILEEGEGKYAERIAKEVGDFRMADPSIVNLKDVDLALDINFKISASGSGRENDIIYLSPMLGQGEKENPFKLEKRLYPVDFGVSQDETYVASFTLPDGYVLDEVPKSVIMNLPEQGGRFTYMVQQQGNLVQVMSKVSISKPMFYANEYPVLKEFYNQIIAKHAEQIVLKKAI